MSDEIALVDTNIIVYAYDTFDKRKHDKCKSLVEAAFKGENRLAVSNQILAETFFVLTRKLKNPISLDDASTIISAIVDSVNWEKINYTHETVRKAALLSKNRNISIWDALIGETALENGIRRIYTENIKDFVKIPGLNVENPMK
ncbi:MAG: PIN domain-containing protein [Candidatus Aenigmatarchaeota archaeon]